MAEEEVTYQNGVEVRVKNGVMIILLRNKGIRCPQCVFNGEESQVRTGVGMCTSAGVSTYYDEQGKYHNHDRNVTRGDWTCNKGHAGKISTMRGCTQNNCSHQGYEVLSTEPSEYRDAKRERKRIEDEKREAERKKREEERAKNPPTEDSTQNTTIGNTIGIGSAGVPIGTYSSYVYTNPSTIYYTVPASPIIQASLINVKMTINGVEYEGTLMPKLVSTVPVTTDTKSVETTTDVSKDL